MKIKQLTGTILDINSDKHMFEAITVESLDTVDEIQNYYEKASKIIKEYIESIN